MRDIRRFHTLFGSTRALPWAVALAGSSVVFGCGSDGGSDARQSDGGSGGHAVDASGTGGVDVGSGGTPDGSGGAVSSSGGRGKGSGGAHATGGATASGGSTSNGGSTSSGGTMASGGAMASGGSVGRGGASSQPIGSICVNDTNCSQAQGMAVCCAIPGCSGPCECRLTTQCPRGQLFLECNTAKDCAVYGGGKICCEAGSGAQTMRYCTKTNGCTGTVLP